jgi:hypothetical protein
MADEVSSLDHCGGSPCHDQLGSSQWVTYSEASRHWVKPDVHLVNKVGGLADAHEWGARVDVFHPAVDLLVGAESEVYQLVLDLDFDAEGLDIDALDINDVDELENEGRRRRLLLSDTTLRSRLRPNDIPHS